MVCIIASYIYSKELSSSSISTHLAGSCSLDQSLLPSLFVLFAFLEEGLRDFDVLNIPKMREPEAGSELRHNFVSEFHETNRDRRDTTTTKHSSASSQEQHFSDDTHVVEGAITGS